LTDTATGIADVGSANVTSHVALEDDEVGGASDQFI
jgi:hypothetical protein